MTIANQISKAGLYALALAGSVVAGAQSADVEPLEEVTVTATRQEDTVNRVPLSITAVTQEHLDEQGIKTAADLVRTVPGLNVVANPGGAQQTFSIRGIVGATGAATTSVYLDDANLTKRANGGVAQNNGLILPLLYDLERVEVLKGPQGTLYGGSSQGGTVRYITPTPSLSEFSGSARAEAATMGDRGELSHELSGAFGGPLVDDKLGFRVSGIYRKTGGWIDVMSAYTNQYIRKDANSTTEWAARGALLWKLNDSLEAQLSFYHVDNEAEGGPSSSTAIFANGQPAAPGTTFTTTQRCITNNTRTAPLAQPDGPPAAFFVPANIACTTPSGVFTRASYTYGPFTTGRDISLATGRQTIVGSGSDADVMSLSLNADLGFAVFKSITSHLQDSGNSNTLGGEEWSSTTPNAGQFTTADPTHRGFPMFQPWYDATGRGHTGQFVAANDRDGFEQEFRLSSNLEGRLNWVTGLYYSNAKTHILYRYLIDNDDADLAMRLMYGPSFSSLSRYGVANDQGFQARLEADIRDKELAAFAEGNLWLIPDRLKAILGLRYSQVKLDYYQTNYGQFSGRLPSSLGAVTAGKGKDEPLTPKFGLQYQFNETNMAYATASKGFRAGGVNAQISQTICESFLTPLGLTAADIPPAFGPDTVWSYELGTKFRILNKLQINLAAFRIDWSKIQATTTLGCGQGFTTNGGRARSEGWEVQAQYRPTSHLSLYFNAGYTDAHYVDAVLGIRGPNATATPTPSFNAGDYFDVPPFQMSYGAQYDFMFGDGLNSYVRLDGTYQHRYSAGATFGSSGYGANYFTRENPTREQLNLRAGVRFDSGLDVNIFVLNLLNADKLITGFSDGRGACSATSVNCSVYTSYSPFVAQTFQTPRRIGVQVNYKF